MEACGTEDMNRIENKRCFDILLDTFGYADTSDLLQHTIPPGTKFIGIISYLIAGILYLTGVPVELLFGLIFGLALELISGTVISIYYKGEPWSSKKFGRFFFKSAILIFLLVSINLMKVGFQKMQTTIYTEAVIEVSLNSLFLFFVLTMSWYITLSVVENMAETGIKFFVTLGKFLRVKTKIVEESYK